MPNVMIRQDQEGVMTLYIAKKDLEEKVVSIEHDAPDRWGGLFTLADGTSYFVEPIEKPSLPITVRAKRGEEA